MSTLDKKVVKPSTEDEMRMKYPCYHGELADFDVNKVRKHLTTREVRKVYKIASSIWRAKEVSNTNREPSAEDCPRCFLIERGSKLLSDRILRTCTLVIPAGVSTWEEKTEPTIEPNHETCEYASIMAASVAAGAVWSTPRIEEDYSPVRLIQQRMLLEPRQLRNDEEHLHKCAATIQPLSMSRPARVRLSDNFLPQSVAEGSQLGENFVLYAPSGIGKTALQTKAMKRGILLRDTDDIPYMTPDKVRHLLRTSSVMTNRLDLLQRSMPTVAVLPASPDVLARSGFPLAQEDFRYWYDCHKMFEDFERVMICRVSQCYVADVIEFETDGTAGASWEPEHDIYDYLTNNLERAKQHGDIASTPPNVRGLDWGEQGGTSS